MNFEKISLLIIAGGKSSRLGQDKRFVEVGGVKLLENILQKAAKENFAEIFLCVEREILPIQILSWKYEAKILEDKIKNVGAISGLANGLSKIKTKWALAVSADMPFFDFEIFKSLEKIPAVKAVVPVVEKNFQPLAGFYHKSLANFFAEEIQNNQTDILNAVKKIPHKFLKLSAEKIFFKIDTQADLRLAQCRVANLSREVPIISFVSSSLEAEKNNFIEKLIKILAEEKISVGVIKNLSRDFNFEIEGVKNFQDAGAKNVAAISAQGWLMIQKTDKRENFLSVAEKMSGADLILIDSKITLAEPAILIWHGQEDIIFDKKVAAIFSDAPKVTDEIFQFDLNDIEAAVKICKFLMR